MAKVGDNLVIREAGVGDIGMVLDFCEKFHGISGLPVKFDRRAMGNLVRGLIESDDAVILMTDHGVIGGSLSPAFCDPDWVIAVEFFWWAKRGGIALLAAFEDWATARGANEVRMSSIASLPRADRLLKIKGYVPAEISYQKVI